VHFRIPAPSGELLANLLGVVGLLCVVLAVGGLAGWWWSLLTAGGFCVGLSVVASVNAEQGRKPAARPVAAPVKAA
jgi:fluoride ion exporter CrcB/FEX